jgi:hypothetical protein
LVCKTTISRFKLGGTSKEAGNIAGFFTSGLAIGAGRSAVNHPSIHPFTALDDREHTRDSQRR